MKGVREVSFLALPYHGDSDFGNIWFLATDQGLLLGTTDIKRGALVRVPVDMAATEPCVGVDCKSLKRFLSSCGPRETVVVYTDGDFVTLHSKTRKGEPVSTRIQMPEVNEREKPFKLAVLRDELFPTHIEIQHRCELIAALKGFGRHIKGVGIDVEAGENSIEMKGPNGIKATVSCAEVKQGLSRIVCLSIRFLRESLMQIEGEKLVLAFDTEKRRVRLQSENTDYTYITVESRPEVIEQ